MHCIINQKGSVMEKNKFILLLMLSLVFSLNHNFEMVDSNDGISSIIFQSDNPFYIHVS